MKKCSFPEGMVIKPDGVNELDPCLYEVQERFANVMIEIVKCKKCGYTQVLWKRQPNTERIEFEG